MKSDYTCAKHVEQSWRHFNVPAHDLPGGTAETHENFGQDRRPLGRDLNQGSPKNEADATH